MNSESTISDTLKKVKRPKVGETLKLSPTHNIYRREKKVYVTTFINLVGGPVSRRHNSLGEAYLQVNRDNTDMINQGRL